jgi:anti-anti-sigma factor
MPDLTIDIQSLPGVPGARKVALQGAIDAKTVLALKSEVSAHMEGGADRFVIDMAQVKYVNSTGLSFFITLAGEGDRLALIHVQPKVKIVFDMMGLGSLFKIVESDDEAVRHVAPRGAAAAPPRAAAGGPPATRRVVGGPPPAPPAPRRGLGLAVALALAGAAILAVSLYLSGLIPHLPR